MKLRIPLLLILLTLLLTPPSFAQTPPESPNRPSSGYGIEPGTLYPGSAVQEILAAAEAEIDAAAREAYDEGYKAAVLRYMPEIAANKAVEAALRSELEAERKKGRLFKPLLYIAGGLLFAGGFGLHALLSR